MLVIAGIGAIVLGVAAVYAFYQRGGVIDRPDAAPRRDARPDLIDRHFSPSSATPDAAPSAATSEASSSAAAGDSVPSAATSDAAPSAATGDSAPPAPTLDATAAPPNDATGPATDASLPPDRTPPIDVRPTPPRHDAGVRAARPDGRDSGDLSPRPDAGPARPTGTATLTIGANPWGNVLLDGKRIGRTPIEHLSVPAGHHVIEVIFAGEDPPRSQKYTVDLTDGDTKDVLADFTKP
jgi:hypothetical protein